MELDYSRLTFSLRVHVVFGKVTDGQNIVQEIENCAVDGKSRPLNDIIISDCGCIDVQQGKRFNVSRTFQSDSSSTVESDVDEEEKETKRKKKSKKQRKEKKKKKKDDSKELMKEKEDGEESENESEVECSIKPGEVPEIPSYKFLSRGERKELGETNQHRRHDDGDRRKDRRDWDRNRSWNLDKDGRIIKGRGNVVYSASTFRRSRSRTPPHWKKELSRLKPLKPDDKSRDRRDHDRHRDHRERDYSEVAKSERIQKDEKIDLNLAAENESSDGSSTPERIPRIQSCVYRVDNSHKSKKNDDEEKICTFQESSGENKSSPNPLIEQVEV